jgi:hypothetical protein
MSGKSGNETLLDPDGKFVNDHSQKANLLNQYFSSSCTSDDGCKPRIGRAAPPDAYVDTIHFTPRDVMDAIRKMKTYGSCGSDSLSLILHKKLSDVIAVPLPLMFS